MKKYRIGQYFKIDKILHQKGPIVKLEEQYTQTVTYVNFLEKDTEIFLTQMEAVQDSYTPYIREFCRFIRQKNRVLSLKTVKEYFVSLNNSGYSANTIQVKRYAVKKRLRDLSLSLNHDDLIRLETSG